MDFCANCETRLTPVQKEERSKVSVLLSCSKCGNEEKATNPIMTLSKILRHSPQERIEVIEKEEQTLRTLPTARIECPRCGNNLACAWMVQIRRLEASSTQFFRCTKCNYTLRDNS